jgi:tRNA1Val (adenine37-N6)-methyltransferase
MTEHRIEPKRVCMVHPYIDKEPSMVLIEGVRDGKPRISVEPPIILYDRPGEYSKFMKENYGF